jgi:hypothetical protein
MSSTFTTGKFLNNLEANQKINNDELAAFAQETHGLIGFSNRAEQLQRHVIEHSPSYRCTPFVFSMVEFLVNRLPPKELLRVEVDVDEWMEFLEYCIQAYLNQHPVPGSTIHVDDHQDESEVKNGEVGLGLAHVSNDNDDNENDDDDNSDCAIEIVPQAVPPPPPPVASFNSVKWSALTNRNDGRVASLRIANTGMHCHLSACLQMLHAAWAQCGIPQEARTPVGRALLNFMGQCMVEKVCDGAVATRGDTRELLRALEAAGCGDWSDVNVSSDTFVRLVRALEHEFSEWRVVGVEQFASNVNDYDTRTSKCAATFSVQCDSTRLFDEVLNITMHNFGVTFVGMRPFFATVAHYTVTRNGVLFPEHIVLRHRTFNDAAAASERATRVVERQLTFFAALCSNNGHATVVLASGERNRWLVLDGHIERVFHGSLQSVLSGHQLTVILWRTTGTGLFSDGQSLQ